MQTLIFTWSDTGSHWSGLKQEIVLTARWRGGRVCEEQKLGWTEEGEGREETRQLAWGSVQ